MNRITVNLLAAGLLCAPVFLSAQGQAQSPSPSNPTQSPDVPKQEPRDNNPDLGAQRTPTPGGTTSKSDTTSNTAVQKTKAKRHKKATTSTT